MIVSAIKDIPGRKYHYLQKYWSAPISSASEVSDFCSKHNFVLQPSALAVVKSPNDFQSPSSSEATSEQETSVKIVRSRIQIRLPYDPIKVDAIKQITGRKWIAEEKAWSIPISSVRQVTAFCELFSVPFIEDAKPSVSVDVIEPVIRMDKKEFVIDFPYDRDIVQRVRDVPTATFDRFNRNWRVQQEATDEIAEFALLTNASTDSEVDEAINTSREEAERIDMSRADDAELYLPNLGGELKPFQRAGVRYALHAMGYQLADPNGSTWTLVRNTNDSTMSTKGVMIADEQGLGKTVQALAVLEATNSFPAVIVVPTSVRLNWKLETQKWLPHRSVEVGYGLKAQQSLADVLIVGWDTLHAWGEVSSPHAVVFDESHMGKNIKSRRTKAAIALGDRARDNGGYVLALSGTPMLNNIEELKSQLRLIDRLDEFGGSAVFDRRFVVPKRPDTAELNRQLRSRCFVRRQKADVLKDLPPKQFTSIVIEGEPRAMREYKRMEKNFKQELLRIVEQAAERSGLPTAEARREAGLAVMRASSAQQLVKVNYLKQLAVKAKWHSVDQWLSDFSSTGKKIVVFGWHREVVDTVARQFGNNCRIQGGMSDYEKQESITKFQEDSNQKVISCSIKAAGVGITLTAASDVLFVEQGWNPADQDQAADRCHRIGQQDSVNVYTTICADTIDERIYKLIERKRKLVSAATEGAVFIEDESSVIGELMTQLVNSRD